MKHHRKDPLNLNDTGNLWIHMVPGLRPNESFNNKISPETIKIMKMRAQKTRQENVAKNRIDMNHQKDTLDQFEKALFNKNEYEWGKFINSNPHIDNTLFQMPPIKTNPLQNMQFTKSDCNKSKMSPKLLKNIKNMKNDNYGCQKSEHFKHQCINCGKKFRTISKLKWHKLRKCKVKKWISFKCNICERDFNSKFKLETHNTACHAGHPIHLPHMQASNT